MPKTGIIGPPSFAKWVVGQFYWQNFDKHMNTLFSIDLVVKLAFYPLVWPVPLAQV
jgi:hypothetical protein